MSLPWRSHGRGQPIYAQRRALDTGRDLWALDESGQVNRHLFPRGVQRRAFDDDVVSRDGGSIGAASSGGSGGGDVFRLGDLVDQVNQQLRVGRGLDGRLAGRAGQTSCNRKMVCELSVMHFDGKIVLCQ